MQCGKFQTFENCLLTPFHSEAVDGAFTYLLRRELKMASQVSFKMEQTVDQPIKKNEG